MLLTLSLPLLLALTLDTQITVGDLLLIGTIITSISGFYWALRGRLTHIEDISRRHDDRMDKTDERIDRLEEVARLQAATVQRLVGRMEAEDRWRQQDRRATPREGTA